MRKTQCTVVHEDFRIKRNAENTLFSRPPLHIDIAEDTPGYTIPENPMNAIARILAVTRAIG